MSRKHVNKGLVPRKGDLPSKDCVACRRPIVWRAKWARDWDRVKYCSERCRRAGVSDGPEAPGW